MQAILSVSTLAKTCASGFHAPKGIDLTTTLLLLARLRGQQRRQPEPA